MKPLLTTLLALLCSAVFFSAAGAPTASAAETGITASGSAANAVADANALGVTWINRWVVWSQIEPNASGSYAGGSIAELDDFVARAAAAHKKVALTVIGTPRWASGSSDYLAPPTDPAAFGRFAGRLAARYAGRVQSWGIWNEPDAPEFWHGTTPSAAAYAPLLKASYSAIKAADPTTQVVAGPLTGNNYQFVDALYAAGAGGSFDAVDVHTDTACGINPPSVFYSENDRVGRFSFLGFREVHAEMAAHGDGSKPIMMSEMGWSATTTRCARGAWAGQKDAGVGETRQAEFLSQAYHCLAGYPYMKAAIWFSARDGGADESELNRYGLIRWNGTKRASWAAMQQVAAKGDQLTGPCGDLEPPAIKLYEPTSKVEFSDALYVKASANDAAGALKGISFFINGNKVAASVAANGEVVERTLDTSKLPLGKTTLKIRAVDVSNNVAVEELVLNKVDRKTVGAKSTKLALTLSAKKLVHTISGRLTVPGSTLVPTGRVRVTWQRYTRKSWVTTSASYQWATRSSSLKNAAAPFRSVQKLTAPGRWRVVASYDGSGPFRKAVAVKSLTIR